jgi:hypothetical protein
VTTNTFDANGPLTDDQIMQTLENELAADGFANQEINLTTDEVTELAVSTGDPLGTGGADSGPFMDTTDTGLSTYADALVPEPASLGLLFTGTLAALAWRRRTRA